MIPITSKCLKQQEDSRPRIIKQPDMRLAQIALPDYCTHIHNPIQMMQSYIKNQFDLHQSHNFMVPADECFYEHNYQIKNNWYINNNSWNEDFYNYKIKREQYDQHKMWPSQIKDEQSPSANHEQGFQACEVLKQQQCQYGIQRSFDDPNKFVGPCLITTKEQKNMRRKIKVQAYLKKKIMRSFQKKIIYKCRKQVADNRIRYRGRFISMHQAIDILKIDPKQSYTSAELMQRLKAHNPLDFQKQDKQKKQESNEYLKVNQLIHQCIVKKNQQEQ